MLLKLLLSLQNIQAYSRPRKKGNIGSKEDM